MPLERDEANVERYDTAGGRRGARVGRRGRDHFVEIRRDLQLREQRDHRAHLRSVAKGIGVLAVSVHHQVTTNDRVNREARVLGLKLSREFRRGRVLRL